MLNTLNFFILTILYWQTEKPRENVTGKVVEVMLHYRVFKFCPDFTKCRSRLHIGSSCKQLIAAKQFNEPNWQPHSFSNGSSSPEPNWFPYIICNSKYGVDVFCLHTCFVITNISFLYNHIN